MHGMMQHQLGQRSQQGHQYGDHRDLIAALARQTQGSSSNNFPPHQHQNPMNFRRQQQQQHHHQQQRQQHHPHQQQQQHQGSMFFSGDQFHRHAAAQQAQSHNQQSNSRSHRSPFAMLQEEHEVRTNSFDLLYLVFHLFQILTFSVLRRGKSNKNCKMPRQDSSTSSFSPGKMAVLGRMQSLAPRKLIDSVLRLLSLIQKLTNHICHLICVPSGDIPIFPMMCNITRMTEMLQKGPKLMDSLSTKNLKLTRL